MKHFLSIGPVPRPALILRLGCLAVVLFVLNACGTRYPLGINESQWQTMGSEERLRAYEQQAALDQAATERRAAEARVREAEAQRQQMALAQARRGAHDGERVQCVLEDAEARLGGKWRRVEPVALDLVHSIPLPFNLIETSGHLRHRTQAHAGFDGQTVTLCRGDVSRERGEDRACARMLGTLADYRRGMEARVEAPHFLRGRLRCELVSVAVRPPWTRLR